MIATSISMLGGHAAALALAGHRGASAAGVNQSHQVESLTTGACRHIAEMWLRVGGSIKPMTRACESSAKCASGSASLIRI
jgi:hypothetical protein